MDNKEDKNKIKSSSKLRRVLRWALYVVIGLVVLLFLLILLIRLPRVQQYITDYATSYFTKTTGAVSSIDRLLITFNGRLWVEGLYVEDLQGDTLLYFESMEAGVAVQTLWNNQFILNHFSMTGLKARVYRDLDQDFNYQFILDAFAPEEKAKEPEEIVRWLISLPDVKIIRTELSYNDQKKGLDAQLDLGSLILSLKPFSSNKTKYEFNNLVLKSLNASIEEWETSLSNSPEEAVDSLNKDSDFLLALALNELALDSINFKYHHRNKETIANIVLGHHLSHGVDMSFPSSESGINIITIKDILQQDLNLLYSNPDKPIATSPDPLLGERTNDPVQPSSFTWPAWEIDLGQVTILNNQIRILNPSVKPTPGVFSANNIDVHIDSLLLPGLKLMDQVFNAEITNLTAKEQSGFQIKEMRFKLEADDQHINLTDVYAQTPRSTLQGDVSLTYDNLDQFIQAFEKTGFSIDLPVFYLAPEELRYFAVDLTKDSLLGALFRYPVEASVLANGTIDHFTINHFSASLGHDVRIDLKGTVHDVTFPEKLKYQLHDVRVEADSQDLALIFPPDSSYSFPAYIRFNGTLAGTTKRIESTFSLNIPDGDLSGDLLLDQIGGDLIYKGDIQIHSLNAARYTNNTAPEMVVGTINIEGEGLDPYNMVASFETEFTSLINRGMEYSMITMKGTIDKSIFKLDGEVDNKNLQLTIDAEGKLDSLYPSFIASIQLAHMDMQAMGLSKDNIQLSTFISATGEGSKEDFDGQLSMTGFKIKREDKSYYMDSLIATMAFNNRSTTFNLASPILSANMNANASPIIVRNGLINHIQTYLEYDLPPLPITNDLTIEMVVDIPETELLRHILLPGLDKMEDSRLTLDFDQKEKLLNMHWSAPYIYYNESSINGFEAIIVSNPDSLNFNLKMDGLTSGIVDIRKTSITGEMLNNQLRTTIDIHDETYGQLVQMTLLGEKMQDSFRVQLLPDKLVFNDQNWDVPTDNYIVYAPNYVQIHNFEVSRGGSKFRLITLPTADTSHLAIEFDEIALEQLLAFINPEHHVASGRLNGVVTLDDLFNKPLLGANLTIKELKALEITLGDLQAEIVNNDAAVYRGDIQIVGPDLDVHLDGTYDLSQAGKASYTGVMQLDKLNLSVLEPVTKDYIKNGSGLISGYVEAGNSAGSTAYKGNLNIEGVAFEVLKTGSLYRIPSEKVNFSNENIVFDQFLISDSEGNPTVLDGGINIVNLINPEFNLNITSKNFKLLESTKENSKLIYGEALLDMTLKLTGTANSPIVRSNLKLKKGTDITFIIPESEVDLIEREGVVIFEERVDGLVVNARDTLVKQQTGYIGTDLQAIIYVDPEAIFQIVIDEQAGDKLVVSGEANLSFDMTTAGKMTLLGTYELRDGFYEMRLYEIVSRRFNLQPGGKLTWSGDPMNATIDIRAIYRARTSALDLMADQLSGADASTTTPYRQELPFDVQLDMKGTLLKPNISFGIDMPENARSALGGQVYNRIRQLNDMDSERNTQVFSLLVLGRFLPQGSSSDAFTKFDASSMARTSASRMLSGQLNALSDKFIKGVDVDLDLESFTDYQSGQPEDRTKLNVRLRQNLFNDRLQVQIGGQVDLEGSSATEDQHPSDLMGDMSIEYRLTKNAQWRLRAFRRNQPQSLIDQQVFINGISLLFSRDFNTFQELFRKPDKSKNIKVIPDPNSLNQ